MIKKVSKTLVGIIACSSILSTHALAAEKDISIKKYDVEVSSKLFVPYSGKYIDSFKEGFKPGFGSGLTLKSVDKNGDLEFYAITDRGPNGDAPNYIQGDKEFTSKFFPSPEFTPSIGILKVNKDGASIKESIPLKNNGKEISGLPVTPGLVGSTNEVALDEDMNKLPYDNNGLDTEGVAVDKDGNFWTVDEYGPFLTKFDKNGNQLEKYAPGKGLPEVLKHRIPNRGFEGITIAPSGKIYCVLQSVLDVNGETAKKAQFIRIVEFDPKTKKTKMFAYPHNVNSYKSSKNAKIGDIYAVSDSKLVIIEQGEDKSGKMNNLIYSVNLAGATDISNKKYQGKELEYATSKEILNLKGIRFAKKELLVDLVKYGWDKEKVEGMCVLPDKKSIAIVNDNDFGMAVDVNDPSVENADITDYVYDSKTKKYTYEGKEANAKISFVKNSIEERNPVLWLIDMNKPIG
ncbi:esterase-like activity of phytase family protein [Clostridium cylindrosporum]|uniref:Phytase-like domain-containing protein n=1 Tax=Clostridium cylindrosporum DSM 605 TaxID=1121307 RepID=A0A0J8DAL9_CLOCY|nr:esterase-like activity of phytase family protein [Clostridium cylindrosporum]KMT22892.1 hypothetical protein CLCY_5c01310 [Clostridium cylindrosporum DSM 605]